MSWGQGTDDVEVTIDLPKGAKARDVSVIIKYNYIKFGLKKGTMENWNDHANVVRANPTLRRLVNGLSLFRRIDPDQSTWAVSDDNKLVISLAKREPVLWSNLYTS